ncbi:MAG TPA: TPM domain-containing protein, partial [Allosphingosinicella sp.]|nr:TPM domain-containing protein [Allosphingosinicella sp.]
MKRLLLPLLILFAAVPAAAQNLPQLSGRIVDQADLLPADREAALAGKLEQLERDTSRQLVVVTVPDLQGYSVEDFGFRLGEQWKLGDKEADNGAILLIGLAEKRMRIEVGDGLEPILPDAMAHIIIRDSITPRFKAGDMAGGIEAGTDAIIAQLRAPPEAAEAKAIEAQRDQAQTRGRSRSSSGASFVPMIFWAMVIMFVLLSSLRGRGRRGRRGPWGGRRYGGSNLPIMLWALGSALDSRHRSSGGGWGGGGGGGFGGFGG